MSPWDHLAKLGSIKERPPVSDDLVGPKALLGQVVVELPATLTELQDGVAESDKVSHAANHSTAHMCLTSDAHVCNTKRVEMRCPSTRGVVGNRTIRCQKEPGHGGLCSYHRRGGQGGGLHRWWGINPEPVGDLTFAGYSDLLGELQRLRHLCEGAGIDWTLAWRPKR